MSRWQLGPKGDPTMIPPPSSQPQDQEKKGVTVKWGNIVFGFNIVTSLSKCLSGDISRSNEFISLV
jgi:hypothetical protein